jgi:hypothetical protein
MRRNNTQTSNIKPTIDPVGTFKNTLSTNFSLENAISEMVDNSIDAGANNIIIHIDTKERLFRIRDNGSGMNKEQLYKSLCYNSRKEINSENHGRFGAGLNMATISLSNDINNEILEGYVSIISLENQDYSNIDNKTLLCKHLLQAEVNYSDIEKNNNYHINSGAASRENSEEWELLLYDNLFDYRKSGTIVKCSLAFNNVDIIKNYMNYSKLFKGDNKNTTPHCIFYWFGLKYYTFVKNKGLYIKLDDEPNIKIEPISIFTHQDYNYPIDEIELYVYEKNKDATINTPNIIVCYDNDDYISTIKLKNKNSTLIPKSKNKLYREFPLNKRLTLGTEKQVDNAIIDNYKLIDIIIIKIQYSPPEKRKLSLRNIIDKYSNINENKQDLRKFLFGKYYSRNKKIIDRDDIPKKDSGDKSDYKYHDDIVVIIYFSSNIDKLMNILTNKSIIDEKNMDETISKTIKYIIHKYCTNKSKLMKNNNSDDDNKYNDSDDEINDDYDDGADDNNDIDDEYKSSNNISVDTNILQNTDNNITNNTKSVISNNSKSTIDDNTKSVISNNSKSTTDNNTKSVISNNSKSTTDNHNIANNTKSVISNNSKSITDNHNIANNTKSTIDNNITNNTKSVIDNSNVANNTKSVIDNSNVANNTKSVISNNSKSTIDHNTKSVISNNSKSTTDNNTKSVISNNSKSTTDNNTKSVISNNSKSTTDNNTKSVISNNSKSTTDNHNIVNNIKLTSDINKLVEESIKLLNDYKKKEYDNNDYDKVNKIKKYIEDIINKI